MRRALAVAFLAAIDLVASGLMTFAEAVDFLVWLLAEQLRRFA
jgi:hypothetical protein